MISANALYKDARPTTIYIPFSTIACPIDSAVTRLNPNAPTNPQLIPPTISSTIAIQSYYFIFGILFSPQNSNCFTCLFTLMPNAFNAYQNVIIDAIISSMNGTGSGIIHMTTAIISIIKNNKMYRVVPSNNK